MPQPIQKSSASKPERRIFLPLPGNEALAERGFGKPLAVAVHALYDEGTAARLAEATAGVATSDTVPHPSNAFSVAELLADAIAAR